MQLQSGVNSVTVWKQIPYSRKYKKVVIFTFFIKFFIDNTEKFVYNISICFLRMFFSPRKSGVMIVYEKGVNLWTPITVRA